MSEVPLELVAMTVRFVAAFLALVLTAELLRATRGAARRGAWLAVGSAGALLALELAAQRARLTGGVAVSGAWYALAWGGVASGALAARRAVRTAAPAGAAAALRWIGRGAVAAVASTAMSFPMLPIVRVEECMCDDPTPVAPHAPAARDLVLALLVVAPLLVLAAGAIAARARAGAPRRRLLAAALSVTTGAHLLGIAFVRMRARTPDGHLVADLARLTRVPGSLCAALLVGGVLLLGAMVAGDDEPAPGALSACLGLGGLSVATGIVGDVTPLVPLGLLPLGFAAVMLRRATYRAAAVLDAHALPAARVVRPRAHALPTSAGDAPASVRSDEGT